LALVFFDFFPVAEDFGGGFGVNVAEDVRVAANHLVVNFADDVVDGEAALLGSDLRVEKNLEEEIAEFFGEFGVVVRVEGVQDFVGFFNEISAEGGVGLFAVPGTAAGGAEASHYGSEFGEGRAGILWTRRFFGAGWFVGRLFAAREFSRGHVFFS